MPFFKTFTPLKTAIAVLASAAPVFAAQAVTPVFINEIHYDNVGTDVGEAIEIAGPAGTNLTGWRIVRYNGNNPNNGVDYTSPAANETLTGTIPDSGIGIKPVRKKLRFIASSLDGAEPQFAEKLEGLGLTNQKELILINDDDFGITGQRIRVDIVKGSGFGR